MQKVIDAIAELVIRYDRPEINTQALKWALLHGGEGGGVGVYEQLCCLLRYLAARMLQWEIEEAKTVADIVVPVLVDVLESALESAQLGRSECPVALHCLFYVSSIGFLIYLDFYKRYAHPIIMPLIVRILTDDRSPHNLINAALICCDRFSFSRFTQIDMVETFKLLPLIHKYLQIAETRESASYAVWSLNEFKPPESVKRALIHSGILDLILQDLTTVDVHRGTISCVSCYDDLCHEELTRLGTVTKCLELMKTSPTNLWLCFILLNMSNTYEFSSTDFRIPKTTFEKISSMILSFSLHPHINPDHDIEGMSVSLSLSEVLYPLDRLVSVAMKNADFPEALREYYLQTLSELSNLFTALINLLRHPLLRADDRVLVVRILSALIATPGSQSYFRDNPSQNAICESLNHVKDNFRLFQEIIVMKNKEELRHRRPRILDTASVNLIGAFMYMLI